jgi:murein DD-endopeptidase MepM/ murein hydrolase activator NlpD
LISTDPFTKGKMHEGMDFTAKVGNPDFATGDGVVAQANNRASGYGNHIVLRHG